MIVLRKGITLEEYQQKEFGIVSDSVNKLREKLANRLTKSIRGNIVAGDSALNKAAQGGIIKLPSSKAVRTNVYKEAHKRGSRISRLNIQEGKIPPQSPQTMTNELANKYSNAEDIIDRYKNKRKRVNRLRNSTERGNVKHQIIIPPRLSGIDQVSHEIGHISNVQSKNPITRLIHKKADESSHSSLENYEMIKSLMGTHRRSGIKSIMQDIINEGSIIAEERGASNKGLRILKKSGATKDELRTAKKNYRLALDSYKNKGLANIKTTIRNTIQPK